MAAGRTSASRARGGCRPSSVLRPGRLDPGRGLPAVTAPVPVPSISARSGFDGGAHVLVNLALGEPTGRRIGRRSRQPPRMPTDLADLVPQPGSPLSAVRPTRSNATSTRGECLPAPAGWAPNAAVGIDAGRHRRSSAGVMGPRCAGRGGRTRRARTRFRLDRRDEVWTGRAGAAVRPGDRRGMEPCDGPSTGREPIGQRGVGRARPSCRS